MNLRIPPGDWLALDRLSAFLPLALAGFVTFAILSVLWIAQLFADQDQGSK
jgi:lipid-A-disaccharide synthase-like uncharacterized protein